MLFVIGLGPSRNFPLSGNSYTCCRRGRPWASRGGDLHAELAYGDHPSDEVAIHKNVCSDVVHGRALVFDFLSAVDILGLRVSPLAVILEPKLRIVYDLPFRARAAGRALTAIPIVFRAAVRARPRSARGVVAYVVSAADARP